MENRIGGKISTNVKSEDREFLYEYFTYYNTDYKSETYGFDIWEEGREGEFKFSFILLILNNSSDLKVIDMNATDKYYRAKGIARAIILESKKIFGKRIISSSNSSKVHWREMRRSDATRV
jgi:hypothetical protein